MHWASLLFILTAPVYAQRGGGATSVIALLPECTLAGGETQPSGSCPADKYTCKITSAQEIWSCDNPGTWTQLGAAGGSGGVSDGDKGDVTVSGSGGTWTLDAGSVSADELDAAGVESELEEVLDLGDLQGELLWSTLSSYPTACTGQFVRGVGDSLVCESVTDADIPNDITIDLATTATALASNGANCSAGQYALGVDATGAAEGCTADDDTPDSDAEVPDNITINTTAAAIFQNTVTAEIQLWDQDRDGDVDRVFCGDWDNDGDLEDDDLDDCIDAITDSDGGVVDLAAGTWTIDSDGDGQGESYCDNYTNPNNPHICLPSNITLRGAGRDITYLDLGTQSDSTCPQGKAPFIGMDIDGDSDSLSTERVANIRIERLSLQGNPGCQSGACGQSTYMVGLWDCDNCWVFDLACRHGGQACVHINRSTNSGGINGYTYRVGNYDTDGPNSSSTTCSTSGSQPALYMYASAGAVTESPVFRDWVLEESGGRGVNVRSEYSTVRPAPFGESDWNFNSTNRQIAQVFQSEGSSYSVPLVCIEPRIVKNATADPTGDVEISIQTCGGTNCSTGPTGTAVAGHDTTDFQSIDADRLGYGQDYECFWNNTVRAAGGGTALSANTEYALVVSYTTATTDTDAVSVMGDDSGTADTYSGSVATYTDIWTYNGTNWTQQVDQDLNFVVWAGVVLNPTLNNITVDTVSGQNGVGGVPLALNGNFGGQFTDLRVKDSPAIQVGVAAPTFEAFIQGLSVEGTANSPDAAIQLGESLVRPALKDVSVKLPQDGVGCVQVRPGARGITMDGWRLNKCGADGVIIGNYTRDIQFINSKIDGAQNIGIEMPFSGTTDGVDHRLSGFLFSNNTIKGVAQYGIRGATAGFLGRYGVISNNSFIDIGQFCMDVAAVEGVSFFANTYRGWALNSGGSTSVEYCIEIDGAYKGVTAAFNQFIPTSDFEASAFRIRSDQSGTGLIVLGNVMLDGAANYDNQVYTHNLNTASIGEYQALLNWAEDPDNQDDTSPRIFTSEFDVTAADSCSSDPYEAGDIVIDRTDFEVFICDGSTWEAFN